MSVLNRCRPALLLAAIAVGAPAAHGADPVPAPAASSAKPAMPSGSEDRLFLSFFQEAVLVKSQWWEGQVEYADGSKGVPTDAFIVRGVVAFRPVKTFEVGGRFGMGSTSAATNRPDGTGATDLDVYGKWVFPNVGSNLSFSTGMILTLPTGDDTVGLGFNSFASQLFGGLRFKMDSVEIGGHVGVRFNGDGDFQGVSINGTNSYEFAATALFPLANQVSLVAEAQVETERFDGQDSITQVLGGVNWRAFGRGMLRGAVTVGLTDGAPDYRALVSYAYTF